LRLVKPLEVSVYGLTADEVAAGDDYISQMRENLTRLEDALGCS
jgi:ABC-type Zn uptake system ZnuABC Zn-binding protein ZnuA